MAQEYLKTLKKLQERYRKAHKVLLRKEYGAKGLYGVVKPGSIYEHVIKTGRY